MKPGLDAKTTAMRNSSYQGGERHVVALILGAFVSTCAGLAATNPETPSEADQIRVELRALKQEYEQRMRNLEERLRRLEEPTGVLKTNVAPVPTATVVSAAPTNAAALARHDRLSRQAVEKSRTLDPRFSHGFERRACGRRHLRGVRFGQVGSRCGAGAH